MAVLFGKSLHSFLPFYLGGKKNNFISKGKYYPACSITEQCILTLFLGKSSFKVIQYDQGTRIIKISTHPAHHITEFKISTRPASQTT